MAIQGGIFKSWQQFLAELQWGLQSAPTNFRFILGVESVWDFNSNKIDIFKSEINEENGYSRYNFNLDLGDIVFNSTQNRFELSEAKRWEITANSLAIQWNSFAVLANAHSQANQLLENVNAATDTLSLTVHGLTNGDEIIITPDTGATLPSGMSETSLYYVINTTPNTFQISETNGGGILDILDAGSGDLRLRYANGQIVEGYWDDSILTILPNTTHAIDWNFKLFNSVLTQGNSW